MEDTQGCEIFFLKIGKKDKNSSQSGDAIVLTMGDRLSNNRYDYKIIVVDGAFKSDAETIKDHLELIDAGNREGKLQIDLMISTHPDQDHISGLIELVEDPEIEVKELWIHNCNRFDKMEITKSISQAKDLISLAKIKGIPMTEPFTGVSYRPQGVNASLEVLGPTQEYYEELMRAEEKVYTLKGILKGLFGKFSEISDQVREQIFNDERLKDPEPNATSNSNNSSTVLLLKFFRNDKLNGLALLTADAGVEALERTVPLLKEKGWYSEGVSRFIQIPHHGSRRNVGPTILDALLGEKEYNCYRGSAFVSAHEKDEGHPKAQVMNAFIRRGFRDVTNFYSSKYHVIGQVPDMGATLSKSLDLLKGEEKEDG